MKTSRLFMIAFLLLVSVCFLSCGESQADDDQSDGDADADGDGDGDDGPPSSDDSDFGALSTNDGDADADGDADDGPPSSDDSDFGALSTDDGDGDDGPPSSDDSDFGALSTDDGDADADGDADDGPPSSDDSDFGALSTDDSESADVGSDDDTLSTDDSETDSATDTDNDTGSDADTEVVLDNPAPAADFTETVAGFSFDMVYIPGGTFTLGCEGDSCPPDTSPITGVTVSSYHMMKAEVTAAMMEAVTGLTPGFGIGTWYDSQVFACELTRLTGRGYRMMTEAEFEYAAKNHLDQLENIDGTEEWAYNSWEATHMGGTDPVGPDSGEDTQKTRRDSATGDNITGRLIRSIDGLGPGLRLVISAEMDYPPGMMPPCHIHPPGVPDEPENSYRDPRWITGSDAHWEIGSMGVGTIDLRVWTDGTATFNGAEGQWFTSNNIAFVFVPDSGDRIHFPYMWITENEGMVICDRGFEGGGYYGRIEKTAASGAKPTITDLKSGQELAAAAGEHYKMVDMENIPNSAPEQDSRLLDGTGEGWFFQSSIPEDPLNRWDVDPDQFRFATYMSTERIMVANGTWFTVSNTLLRITEPGGYIADYLYAFSPDGTVFTLSYQAFERAELMGYWIIANDSEEIFNWCDLCHEEIPMDEGPSVVADHEEGHSTFVPAPCPTGGCD